ncbi:GRAM domain-containing protein 2B-like isoform X2 [Anabas testudineus]|uniref:GRAM domain-containing protein 2B-like isoform X2 n=1 Tax=Anabas testudineus TaxID=64144 RepID=UPI000E456585|nr:GRAM domain-containing protein 2B-like isoform X2 [Anabas testudineus]
MSFKNRKFSLDSSCRIISSHVYLLLCWDSGVDGDGVFVTKRGSSKFSSKKSKQSLDEARLEIQQLNDSINPNTSTRKQVIAEENTEQSDEPINNHNFQKHSKTFNKLFQDISERENLIHTFTCALQKEVPYHGKLFVSENHVCFHSSVLLKETKVVITVSSIKEVKKHNSALSMLSIQTTNEKYSFVSLRNRELCYKHLQSICSHAQRKSPNSSSHLSPDNEANSNVVFSSSSLEDNTDQDLTRQNKIHHDNGCPQMFNGGPTSCNSPHQRSLNDDRAVSWLWRVVESVPPVFLPREHGHISIFFYIYVMLVVLLLVVSGYIGLRIIALEEQLNSLGALTELSLHYREYQER